MEYVLLSIHIFINPSEVVGIPKPGIYADKRHTPETTHRGKISNMYIITSENPACFAMPIQ